MNHHIKTSHGIAILGACFLVAVILISQFSKQLNLVSLSIPPHTQLAQVSCTIGDLTCGLVGWWKFDEGSGITAADSSGNGKTATLSSPQWVPDTTRSGYDLSFGGTDSVSIPNIPMNSALGGFNTVSFWMNWNGIVVNSLNVLHFPSSNYGFIIESSPTAGVCFTTGNGDCYGISGYSYLTSITNQWIYVTLVFNNGDENQNQIYINGSLAQIGLLNGATTTASFASSQALDIGSSYSGLISDVRVYGRQLTALEVADLYNLSPTVSNITSSGATISWTTDTQSTSQVEYGTTASYSHTTTLDSTPVTAHSQTISNLQPNTTYHYAVKSGSTVSDDYKFSTASVSTVTNSDKYITQTAQGTGDASSCANAQSVAWFNDATEWGTDPFKIGPGNTVHLCGTVSTGLSFQGSGTSGNPITLKFESGAKMSALVFPLSININGKSYITVNGCTNSNGICTAKDYSKNATIENTDNGSPDQYWTECLAFSSPCQQPHSFNHRQTSTAVSIGGGNNVTVENLNIQNLYVRASSSDDPTGGFNYQGGGSTGISWGGSNILIFNNAITYAQTMIMGAMGGHDITIDSNKLLNFNWGIIVGSGETAGPTLDKLNISNNNMDGFDVWENSIPPGTDIGFHRDGIYLFIDNPVHQDGWFRNVNIYGNYIGPGVNPRTSTAGTGAMFFGSYKIGQFQNVRVYNNISLLKPNFSWSGGNLLGGPMGTNILIANNSMLEGGGLGAGGKYLYIYNNLKIGGRGEGIQTNDTDALDNPGAYIPYIFSDYNLFNGLGSNSFNTSNIYSNPNAGEGYSYGDPIFADTLSEWTNASAQAWDAHSLTSDPLIVSANPSSPDFHLQASSPAIGAGKNLSDFDGTNFCTGWPQVSPSGDPGVSAPTLCSDYAGNSRPGPTSGEAWDIGAYQYCTSGCAPDPVVILPSPPSSPSPDTTAPSVPSSLATTSVTSSSVGLSWSASTDPTVSGQTTSGLAGYKLYRCQGSSCAPSTQIGTSITSGRTYTDSSVVSSTHYTYTVSAYDNAIPANESNKSSSVSVTTPAVSSVGTTYTLTYTANTHGSLTGTATQTVNSGGSGSVVTAVPDTGYSFTSWSDNSTTNPRTDTNVLSNVTVSASFTASGNAGGGTTSGGGGGGGGGGSSYIPTTPTISNITTTPVGATSMTITWSTSLPASSQILYGLTTIYGSQTSLVSTFTTTHSVTLTNLQSNTVYHFKILSTASGNTAPASDMTFTTGKTSTYTTTPTSAPTTTNCPAGLTCTPASVSSISPSTISPSTPITKFLSLGSSDVQVLTLQKILSSLGYLKVTPTGFYGSLTQAAVESFQKANGIPTVGTVGPLTRTALNKYVTTASIAVPAASTVHIAQPQVSTPSVNGTFTRTLKLGSTGSDVTALQVFLNTHGFIVATSGNGSPGHESTYYGPATAAAVSRFQMAHALQILTPNGLTQGTGNFGPATMKAVNGMK